jgi:hypothetical protein
VPGIFQSADYARAKLTKTQGCQRCGDLLGVQLESARTAYHYDGQIGDENDPNRPVRLCRPCAAEHHLHWDMMWSEYYAGCL